MPDLKQSFQGHDLGRLRIVAELWGVELDAPDFRTGLERLVPLMLSCDQVDDVFQALSEQAKEAIHDLQSSKGRISWSLFVRKYGEVREMGVAQRDREIPYKQKVSISETLWYRGIVGRNFFDTPNGPEEFAYIPSDLLVLLPPIEGPNVQVLGRPAKPTEKTAIILADDSILDEACLFLAGLRMGWKVFSEEGKTLNDLDVGNIRIQPRIMKAMLAAAGLLDMDAKPLPEPTRSFLEASRKDALVGLVKAWLNSMGFNELLLLPGLIAEGEWKNDPFRARHAVIEFLSTIPGVRSRNSDPNEPPFWSLSAFIEAVYKKHPDFQRTAGEYDSWYLKDRSTGEYYRGFEHWNEVDGALIEFLITGPLHWLGILDLASPGEGLPVSAFRFSQWASELLNLVAPQYLDAEEDKVIVSGNMHILSSRSVPRSVRYLIARFCELEKISSDGYRFRLTTASLRAAQQQNLRIQHLLTLLVNHAKQLPPNLVKALERWDRQGSEVEISRLIVLRVKDPELLNALRSSKAQKYLGALIGPAAIVVKEGAQDKLLGILADMGILGEIGDS